MSFGAAATAASNAQGDISKDVPISPAPEDGISDLAFSPKSDHLAVAAWDKKVRIYEINNGVSTPVAAIEHEGPVLGCCWSSDGTKVVGVGADKAARMMDTTANKAVTQVAVHDAPIKCARFVNVGNQEVLVTGGWDKKLKYWDLRTANPIHVQDTQERVYCMDTKDKLLVVGTADRYINVYNLAEPTKTYKVMQSPLKWQTRCVSCFTDAKGFAVGSIEGRCAIQYIEEKDSSANFSFKCHRQNNPPGTTNAAYCYSVNSINFHPTQGTFSTAGSDGTFHFWDKDAKHRLKGYPEVGGPISATAFNSTGSIFAYAVSYDWSKGYQFNNPQMPNKVMLHPITEDEVKPKPKTRK